MRRRRSRRPAGRLRVHPEFHRHLLLVCLLVIVSWVLPGGWAQLSNLGFSYLTLLLGLRIGPLSRRRGASLGFRIRAADAGYMSLAIATAVTQVLWLLNPQSLRVSGIPLLCLITLFIAWSVVRLMRVLSHELRIDGRSLCGATAGYLLLGISGGLVLTVLDSILPGSFQDNLTHQPLSMPPFSLLAGDPIVWDLDYARLNYFAFVSLTTLGYGDITPVVPVTRLACLMLSVIGPLYIAVVLGVLISRLSAMTSQQPAQPPHWRMAAADPPPADRFRAPAPPDPGPGGSAP